MTRLSFKIPTPTVDMLNAYLKAYEVTYKKPANGGFIVNEILLSFFNSDKNFQEFLRKNHENLTSKQHPETNQPGGSS